MTLTDDQIAQRAHEIYLRRQQTGEPGDADTDWQHAIRELEAEAKRDDTRHDAEP